MKTFTLVLAFILLSCLTIFAQKNLIIRSGGAVTVNGNMTITSSAFVCGNPMTDTRDGKTYATVLIGTQCWMAQNLNYGTRINGVVEQTNNNTPEKYCYNNLEANCDVYGGLYQWGEMVQYLNGASNTTSWNPIPTGKVTGLCPTGWHLPSIDELTSMSTYLGGETVAGGKMKEAGTTHWWTPNTGASNSSGFTALPSGLRNYAGNFFNLFFSVEFLSSSEHNPTYFKFRACQYNSEGLLGTMEAKSNGISARCLKD